MTCTLLQVVRLTKAHIPRFKHHIMSRAVHTRSVLTVGLFYKDTRLNAAAPIMQDA